MFIKWRLLACGGGAGGGGGSGGARSWARLALRAMEELSDDASDGLAAGLLRIRRRRGGGFFVREVSELQAMRLALSGWRTHVKECKLEDITAALPVRRRPRHRLQSQPESALALADDLVLPFFLPSPLSHGNSLKLWIARIGEKRCLERHWMAWRIAAASGLPRNVPRMPQQQPQPRASLPSPSQRRESHPKVWHEQRRLRKPAVLLSLGLRQHHLQLLPCQLEPSPLLPSFTLSHLLMVNCSEPHRSLRLGAWWTARSAAWPRGRGLQGPRAQRFRTATRRRPRCLLCRHPWPRRRVCGSLTSTATRPTTPSQTTRGRSTAFPTTACTRQEGSRLGGTCSAPAPRARPHRSPTLAIRSPTPTTPRTR